MFANIEGSALLAYVVAAGVGVVVMALARLKRHVTTPWAVAGMLVSCLLPPYGSLMVIAGLLGYLVVKQLRRSRGQHGVRS